MYSIIGKKLFPHFPRLGWRSMEKRQHVNETIINEEIGNFMTLMLNKYYVVIPMETKKALFIV